MKPKRASYSLLNNLMRRWGRGRGGGGGEEDPVIHGSEITRASIKVWIQGLEKGGRARCQKRGRTQNYFANDCVDVIFILFIIPNSLSIVTEQ